MVCLVERLSHLTMTKLIVMSDQKPPFVFDNYPLHLFTLTTASPLINSCSTQKTWKTLSDDVVFMFFSAGPHLHARLHSPWFYMTVGMKICDHLQYKLAQSSQVFSYQKNISCMQSICADACNEVSCDFQPNFHYSDGISTLYGLFNAKI